MSPARYVNRLTIQVRRREIPQILAGIHHGTITRPLRAVRAKPLLPDQLEPAAAVLLSLHT